MKKLNHLQKQLKFHCDTCQTIYQLLEIQLGNNNNCLVDCLTKWQELLAKYYQEKLLFYFSQQEPEKEEDDEDNFAKKLEQMKRERK